LRFFIIRADTACFLLLFVLVSFLLLVRNKIGAFEDRDFLFDFSFSNKFGETLKGSVFSLDVLLNNFFNSGSVEDRILFSKLFFIVYLLILSGLWFFILLLLSFDLTLILIKKSLLFFLPFIFNQLLECIFL
jgi:hypothetical protein